MRNLYYTIKWAYQRTVRGWDDTATWGLDCHFIEVIIPPLEDLCRRSLQEMYVSKENETRRQVYETTLDLIEDYKRLSDWDNVTDRWDSRKEDEALKTLAGYFAENIGWYWD